MTLNRNRQSGFTSFFKPAWEYNYDTLNTNIIIPVLENFPSPASTLSKATISSSHNFLSHTQRLGLININGDRVNMTALGADLLHGRESFEVLFQNFLPSFYVSPPNTNDRVYPYVALFFCLGNGLSIRKLDFMFALYPLTNTSQENLEHAADVITDLQIRYPLFDTVNNSLTDGEKIDLLNELNDEFGTTYSFQDLWTSQTAVTNRYSYFKNHLSIYSALTFNRTSFRTFSFLDLL